MSNKKDTTTIGGRIYELRKAAGIGQDKLAELTGVGSRVSISQYETGVRIPSTDNIVELAKALNTTTDYLLTGKQNLSANFDEVSILFNSIPSAQLKALALEQLKAIVNMSVTNC